MPATLCEVWLDDPVSERTAPARCRPAGYRASVPGVEPTDALLADRMAAGDDNALAEVYDGLGQAVYGAALRVLGDWSAAQDVVQDVFVELWSHPGRYDPTAGVAGVRLYLIPGHAKGSGKMSRQDRQGASSEVMRLLGAVRLSRDTDETTSPERQDDAITYTTKARGDRLIHIVHDLDVSGAISPFERAELGPWLTDPDKIAQWDGLIVAKIDRLSRSLLDFQVLLKWCDAHDKTVISIGEGFDLKAPVGRLNR